MDYPVEERRSGRRVKVVQPVESSDNLTAKPIERDGDNITIKQAAQSKITRDNITLDAQPVVPDRFAKMMVFAKILKLREPDLFVTR